MVIFRVASTDFTVPVETETDFVQLFAVAVDIVDGSDGGMLSSLDSVLFGRKSVSIISHRIEDIKALQAFVTCINVAGNVSQRVSHMQSCSRWIREHIKHVEFLF